MPPDTNNDGRRAARVAMELPVTLRRKHGNPIISRTVDVGCGGMRVCCDRPLGVDELLSFELDASGERVDGRARVLREHVAHIYALRFETLAAGGPEVLQRLTPPA